MIKARVNKKKDAVCDECGADRKTSLDLFDIMLAGNITTVCDQCADDLLYKSLGCVCHTNHRVKSPQDLRIIRQRHWWKEALEKRDKKRGKV